MNSLLNVDWETISQHVSKIKLPGGVVGKVCGVLVVACISMGAIACATKLVWLAITAVILIFILCFVMLWRVISFADRNPQAALLEGAEFLVHEQLRLGMKEKPNLSINPKEFIESHPVNLSKIEQQAAQQPDSVSSITDKTPNDNDKEGKNG